MSAWRIKISFNNSWQRTLILITLTCCAGISDAGYTDVGYRKEILLSALMRVDSVFYVKAKASEDVASFGLGIGYTLSNYEAALTYNKTLANNYTTIAELNYYDVNNMSYFTSIDYNNDKKLSYKIGVGYPINEKVSIIAHYSNDGVFFGFRRWFN